MAKKKKMPKALRASAPLAAHQRNAAKIKEVIAYNKKIDSDELAKKRLIEANKKLRAQAKK